MVTKAPQLVPDVKWGSLHYFTYFSELAAVLPHQSQQLFLFFFGPATLVVVGTEFLFHLVVDTLHTPVGERLGDLDPRSRHLLLAGASNELLQIFLCVVIRNPELNDAVPNRIQLFLAELALNVVRLLGIPFLAVLRQPLIHREKIVKIHN